MYQRSIGGTTHVPCDKGSRIIEKATPRLAKIIGYKYAQNGAMEVKKDLKISNRVDYNMSYIQDLISRLSTICEEKEYLWSYEIPEEILKETASVSVSRDGAMVGMTEGGYREAMGGVLSLCDKIGKSIYTVYIAKSPEYGKEKFNAAMDNEINILKTKLPKATYVGLADGARDNWQYLVKHTDVQILDYYHATEYVHSFADAYFKDKQEGKKWSEKAKVNLQDDPETALMLWEKMSSLTEKMSSSTAKEICQKSVVYFANNKEKMDYYNYINEGYAIGSGVMEAACKTLIKQRCSRSGMRWTTKGLNQLFAIKQLVFTGNRWEQFWDKIDRYGF